MIAGFQDADTDRLWKIGWCIRLPAQLHRQVLKKLYILNAVLRLENLMAPPGNQLERLLGDRKGQHSIRINDLYRICFVWHDGNAHEVEVADYNTE
jgi:proteic killer suppression protein